MFRRKIVAMRRIGPGFSGKTNSAFRRNDDFFANGRIRFHHLAKQRFAVAATINVRVIEQGVARFERGGDRAATDIFFLGSDLGWIRGARNSPATVSEPARLQLACAERNCFHTPETLERKKYLWKREKQRRPSFFLVRIDDHFFINNFIAQPLPFGTGCGADACRRFSKIQHRRICVDCARIDFVLRHWQDWAPIILDWLHCGHRALSHRAFLAPVDSISGGSNRRLARVECVSRALSRRVGLALLENFIAAHCRRTTGLG